MSGSIHRLGRTAANALGVLVSQGVPGGVLRAGCHIECGRVERRSEAIQCQGDAYCRRPVASAASLPQLRQVQPRCEGMTERRSAPVDLKCRAGSVEELE